MTGQMGRALESWHTHDPRGLCVCEGEGDEFHVCADMSTLGTLSFCLSLFPGRGSKLTIPKRLGLKK